MSKAVAMGVFGAALSTADFAFNIAEFIFALNLFFHP